jgi:pectinesterase
MLFVIVFSALLHCYYRADAQKNMVVAQDGSGNYTTVQAALDAVPENNGQPVNIYIKNGIYKEKLHLDSSKNFVQLKGEDRFKTILTYDDHTGKITSSGQTINTFTSYTFLIEGNNFTAQNITFRNDAGINAGQAVGLDVKGDKAAFINCRIIGNQDILLAHTPDSREYYSNCYIEGTTDFIFGAATAFFAQCEIYCKKNSHITAASTPQEHTFGFVFYNCKITGDTNVVNADLGRPWRDYAAVVYLHCYIGECIAPQGWSNWHDTQRDKTARFAEYKNYGPGANTSSRVAWSHQLTDEQVEDYTKQNIFRDWNPLK